MECTGDYRRPAGGGWGRRHLASARWRPLGELQIHNRNGAIHLTVPREQAFNCRRRPRTADIDSKLDLPVSSAGEGQSISGKVGAGGPRIELIADHGDIEITGMERFRRAAFTTAPCRATAPPAPPGAKSMRHLRPSKGASGDVSSAQPVVGGSQPFSGGQLAVP